MILFVLYESKLKIFGFGLLIRSYEQLCSPFYLQESVIYFGFGATQTKLP